MNQESCNMGGLEGSLNDGLIKFKANFNPTINEFIGNSIYRLINYYLKPVNMPINYENKINQGLKIKLDF